jgi:acetyl esterase/lipase
MGIAMAGELRRRDFLWGCAAGVGSLALRRARGQDRATRMRTYTYKKVGKLSIKAAVYGADDVARPVLVWIHGGALIMGHRNGVNGRVKKMMLAAGYVLVSIDYRLAPETKLPHIIQDLEDAFAWVRTKGPALFHADAGRIAVMGGSAGGYLTLTAGHRVKPRPAVLVSFWGYGDLIGDWYSRPSRHPRHHRVKMTEAEAYRQVSGPPISDSRDRKGNGGAFYQYCRQHGTWPHAVSGWDPRKEARRFHPYMPVKNVTADYPPTLLIHGTKDTDVPYEQSTMMAEQLKKHGVPHELISISGAEHGLAGGDPKQIDAAYESALRFTNRHIKAVTKGRKTGKQ